MKVHFLYSHLDKFPEKRENICDDQRKCFHTDIKEWRTNIKGDGVKQ